MSVCRWVLHWKGGGQIEFRHMNNRWTAGTAGWLAGNQLFTGEHFGTFISDFGNSNFTSCFLQSHSLSLFPVCRRFYYYYYYSPPASVQRGVTGAASPVLVSSGHTKDLFHRFLSLAEIEKNSPNKESGK